MAPAPVTQIIYLHIPPDRQLKEGDSYQGKLWTSALDVIERSDGFQRVYWGRSLEHTENVQVHVGMSYSNLSMMSVFGGLLAMAKKKNECAYFL